MQINNNQKTFLSLNITNLPQQNFDFPLVITPSNINSFVYLQQIFAQYHHQIVDKIIEVGGIYFRGFDIKNVNQYASILAKLGLKTFQYLQGTAVRHHLIGSTLAPSKSIQVFTTNQSPSHHIIPLHNQLAQTPNYPHFVSFYCHIPADQGGSTPIIDGCLVYQYLQKTHPTFLNDLITKKLKYTRIMGQHDNKLSPTGRGWRNMFGVQNRQQAEIKLIQNDYQWKWLNNSDNDLKITTKPLQAYKINKKGKKAFFNQIIGFYKRYKNSLYFGDNSQIPIQILDQIYQFTQKNKVSIPWQHGDFMILDNQSVLHSRQVFSGERHICASLFQSIQRKNTGTIDLILNSGDPMPIIGFGTWKIPKDVASELVYNSIKEGYRLIDCASDFNNQYEVGLGINKAIKQGIVNRQDLFIVSKLWSTYHQKKDVKPAFLKTLKDLNLSYLDLYLIHFPISLKYVPFQLRYPPSWIYNPNSKNSKIILNNVPIIQTWKAMEELHRQGLVRNLGVSNFSISHLRDLINSSFIKPAVLQAQIHPYFTQKKLMRFCRQYGIQITSYSTIGAASYLQLGLSHNQQLMSNSSILKEICNKDKNKGKTMVQVILRWAIQQGLGVIPKTVRLERLIQNLKIINWNLTNEQMKLIDILNRNRRYNNPSEYSNIKNENICIQIFDN